MVAHKVDKERWPHHLAPQLTGKDQLAFAALPTENVDDYVYITGKKIENTMFIYYI